MIKRVKRANMWVKTIVHDNKGKQVFIQIWGSTPKDIKDKEAENV